MYAEEYLGEDAYEVSDVSSEEETTTSVNSEMKERRKIMEQYKKLDKGYYKYKIFVNGELQKIESYSTPLHSNALIRHAVDGIRCPHRVGSKHEDLYFKVSDTTTENGPRRLYYYSPEEFERHQYVTVSQSIKEDWNIRNMRANKLFN